MIIKSKKIMAIVIAGTLMSLALGACGSVKTETVSETETVSAEATVSEDETNMEKPDGEPPTGEKPDGEPPKGGHGGPGGAPGGAPGSSSADIDYTAVKEVTLAETISAETISSTSSDENALLVSTSENVSISDVTVNKSGDSDGGDNCNFYGLNATILVKDGSTTTITGANITSDAEGANGVFSYGGNGGQNGAEGDETTVIIKNSTIVTTGNGSGGIMTTGGGTTNAYNLDITTSGRSSAAIRTDRGGGTVYVDGGTYVTNGLGSPAIYSTADITVENATLTSNLSEGVCIEGKNSITLKNCDMTANNTDCNGNATFNDTIMIYQSMSGDADSGTSSFDMTGGSLTSLNGHMFHVTNTNAVITLEGVKLVNKDSDGILLSVCDDGWSGAENKATLNLVGQIAEGTILVGDNSYLTLNIVGSSTFTGCFSGEITNAKGATVSSSIGSVTVTLESGSIWNLTGDCYIDEFNGDASGIVSNGYTVYVNGNALAGTKKKQLTDCNANGSPAMCRAPVIFCGICIIFVCYMIADLCRVRPFPQSSPYTRF